MNQNNEKKKMVTPWNIVVINIKQCMLMIE